MPEPVGCVASPYGLEATSEQFAFWVSSDQVVEKSQIVSTTCRLGGEDVTFYGVVEEVRRRSRTSGIHEDFDGTDGDPTAQPPYEPEGVTYAEVSILQADPNRLTPPLEQSPVFLGGEAEAARAFGFDEMNRPLPIGLLRNGGTRFAGPAFVDLDFLLGENGGHLNVNGMPGVGTKSSFLLSTLASLLHVAAGRNDLAVVPVVFNVKGEDLLWIDRPNRDYRGTEHDAVWEGMGMRARPFEGAQFFTPTDPSSGGPMVDGCTATPYRWSFRDVLRGNLFLYLFADDSINELQRALVLDLAAYFTERDGTTPRTTPPSSWDGTQSWPQSWDDLLNWMEGWVAGDHSTGVLRTHSPGTKSAVLRRLLSAVREGRSIFVPDAVDGNPLNVVRTSSSPPLVVDINSLSRPLQRFVVAAVSRQIVEARTGRGLVRGLRYVIVLDELNRFAPRGAGDPVTRLFEEIATELRSRGVILFGAQQFASEVSTKVVESASVRAVGRTGSAELSDRVWKGWSQAAKRQAGTLRSGEKLVFQPTFREPMLVNTPFPAWAMRREDQAATRALDDFSEV